MLRNATVPSSRAWNTWSERPAEMVFLPLGVRLTPVLYSTRSRAASLISLREDAVRLGPRDIDAGFCELETDHAGTTLHLRYDKPDPFTIVGRWSGIRLGEWGLRVWVTLCLSAEGGERVRYGAERGVAVVKVGARHVALASREAPVQVTGHDTVEALAADFEANGYFHTASRRDEAAVIALRFNLEMTREGAFAASVADSEDLAVARAVAALEAEDPGPAPALHTGRFAGALDAVRDVLAWNTMWDGVNGRPYTNVSRVWNLGAFAVWYNDQTFAALMAGLFDGELARENTAVALASATPQGNFACIVTANDAWVDRSQPPFGSFVAWQLFGRTGDRLHLSLGYEALCRNQRWWRANRDPEASGLVSCGTSDVGEGLYRGTHFGARNETGMDNSATHDEAVYDPATRTLSTFDLGLNCALALDAEMLALIARELGREKDAAEFAALAEETRERIRTGLWDEERRIFANRQRSGAFLRSLAPTSFYPLLCGAATAEQAGHLLRHLRDPATFGGEYGLPNAARNDPAFADDVYWRGRVWPNVNYFVWQGLRRYGFEAEASDLAAASLRLFERSWQEDRIAAENYSAATGEADGADTDRFYVWGAMLPLMAVGEVIDVTPWSGWRIVNTGEPVRIGPIGSPVGPVVLTVRDGVAALAKGDRRLFETDIVGRIDSLRFDASGCSAAILPDAGGQGFVALPWLEAGRVVAVRVDGRDAAWTGEAGGIRIALGCTAGQAMRLAVAFSPEP